MRRKANPADKPAPASSTLSFKDCILTIPRYSFGRASPWDDTGSMTYVAEGTSLKDGSNVLAKITPSHSSGSVCLEREAHILGKLATSDVLTTTLRLIDFLTIPRANGDCVVLLLSHPGLNMLGRYFPPSKVNDFLLADITRRRNTPCEEMYMTEHDQLDSLELESFDVMDLASFLEFAIQATHCLEIIHRAGIIHREVRANAFHLNSHSGLVRFVHFGNRAVSLEEFGGPSTLIIRALDETKKTKVKEALCYLAPEQTGSMEIINQDHRTDLYSLGMMFWTLLVGQGVMPFEGRPFELLHSIVQKRPIPVHEIRRDVPIVLATIIDKLLAKCPDARYQSAYGLKADLLECQLRLLATVSSVFGQSPELIPSFDIATQDRYTAFTIPVTLFGREKELETVRNVIRHATTSFSRRFSTSRSVLSASSQEQGVTTSSRLDDDREELVVDDNSERSQSSEYVNAGDGMLPLTRKSHSPSRDNVPPSYKAPLGMDVGDDLRKVMMTGKSRLVKAHTIMVVGPPGVGKSSLVLANQAKWRSHGLWGQAKFQNADSAPFAALLGCLSSVLRQLMIVPTDLRRFVDVLKERLGPQIQNLALLYQGTPELRDVLEHFGIKIEPPAIKDHQATLELRARFQSLVANVFSVLAEIRLFALFLDDIHEADDSSLDLIETLINSKSCMLIFGTLRSDVSNKFIERIRTMCSHKNRTTWIHVKPLNHSAICSLVSKTLHREMDDCIDLSRFLYTASSGNAFIARNVLTSFQRQNFINFDSSSNHWQYDIYAIEASFSDKKSAVDQTNESFLLNHFRELPDEAKRYLLWASFFGVTFKVTEVALLMDWEGKSGGSSDEDEAWNVPQAVSLQERSWTNARGSMRGLQAAISEGWLIQRALCSFAHDRYLQAAQAEAKNLPDDMLSQMSFRITLMMLHDPVPDVHRIAEHAKRCIPLLQAHRKRDELLDVLIDAGDSAWARGAHELALQAFSSARSLLPKDAWDKTPRRTCSLFSKLAALFTWRGDFQSSEVFVDECIAHAEHPEDKGQALRLQSNNHWMRNNFSAALEDTIYALRILGVDVNPAPSIEEAVNMFEDVKNEILEMGYENILSLPRATESRIDLAVAVLNDAGANAYWTPGDGFADVIGLTTIRLALKYGMSPGTSLGFFWALGAVSEQREIFGFSADLGKLGLRIADIHGGSLEKCRANVLYVALVAPYDNVHIRASIPRLEVALKYGHSAGDRPFTTFSSIHNIVVRLYACDHLSELVLAAEESASDIELWIPGGDANILSKGVLCCIYALAGYTDTQQVETSFDTDTFKEEELVMHIQKVSGNPRLLLGWYNSFKVVALFCIGHDEAAAELGFSAYTNRNTHPNHRHSRYAAFFHSLALIACVRKEDLSYKRRDLYLKQVQLNQTFIRKWLSSSPVNTSTWVALVDAELASLNSSSDALKLYDVAVKLALKNNWHLEEGWALFLQGCHLVRCGVEGLGSELQHQGVMRQSQWGAQGIVRYMSSTLAATSKYSQKHFVFSTADVAVQTDNVLASFSGHPMNLYGPTRKVETNNDGDQEISTLTASDLASVLKWSKDISSDLNLSSALQRLTEIATEASRSQNTCLVITGPSGEYTVATRMVPPELCQVYENQKSIGSICDPLQKTVIQHALNSKLRVYYEDAAVDPRFSSEATLSQHRSVICLPIFSNRGQTFGAIYVSSKYAFSHNTVTILTLLLQQASISISSALLFRSVQAGTRENLKMISAQREALEAARKSREDALKATKIKSNFLASMSHELRTPFSSFYGLLDLLSGTELNPGQSEIVQTAKQSCELLLKIIDSILDYSKLEASAVKLEFSGFPVENIIADCMELLLPMAAKKLDLSFNIERDVPPWIMSDYARIRQVLMNLIGNAVKFTPSGYVTVICSVNKEATPSPGEVNLKFTIRDTGIGLSSSAVELLFVPFQQADNSSTRRFGGTGLGLSISLQLVKLMGGAIGVESELDKGSMFWFTLPVKLYESDESRKSQTDITNLQKLLITPQAPRILLCSRSETTAALLEAMLDGFHVDITKEVEEAKARLQSVSVIRPLDFLILDDQSEKVADELFQYIMSFDSGPLRDSLIHLYTPTTDTLSSQVLFKSTTPGVVRMTKPPRKARLLQILANLKNLSEDVVAIPGTEFTRTVEDSSTRILFGNVLIAEDNPVAQNLLVKQLERYQFNVTATSNGEEAIKQWKTHEPGFFSIALFDHHMPVCDGVEASTRIRLLEREAKVAIQLPIVALSADCQESTKQRCLSAGMNLFLSKPLKKADLLSLLSFNGPPSFPTHSSTL